MNVCPSVIYAYSLMAGPIAIKFGTEIDETSGKKIG